MFLRLTALLLTSDKQFARHSAVISEFNRTYVKTGQVDAAWSKFYQKLFADRQESDYVPTTTFESADVAARLEQAESFVAIIRDLVERKSR